MLSHGQRSLVLAMSVFLLYCAGHKFWTVGFGGALPAESSAVLWLRRAIVLRLPRVATASRNVPPI